MLVNRTGQAAIPFIHLVLQVYLPDLFATHTGISQLLIVELVSLCLVKEVCPCYIV